MQGTQRWRFGPFEADAREQQLLHDGRPVPVTRKSFALLATLLGRPGKLFTKSELFETVWAGSVVTDAALSRVIRELRVALGDDPRAPRFIATAHGVGFRFVAPVEPVPQEPQASAPLAPSDRRLVGRDRELDALEEAFADACSGRRRVVFVTGEAGIGKTALVEAFIERQTRTGDRWVAQGRCVEQYGTGEAYLPILEALEQLARQVGVDAFREVLMRYAPAWLAQLPWLAHDADPAALQRALVETTSQHMLREIAQALEVLAARRPLVLWLEDLHWSDPSSLVVVSFLAGRRDPARLLLIGSLRPGDARAEAASPLPGLMLQLMQRGQARELALALLDVGAVRRYLELRLGDSPRVPVHELGVFIHGRTDGNALFTVAVVDDLVRRRELSQEQGHWTLTASVAELGHGLPDSLRHLVHDQIERLSADDRRLVEAAAVAGADFCAAAVAAALQGDPADIEDRCARLAQQGRLLRQQAGTTWPDGTVSGGFGFLHALYWQAIHERVPQGRRAEWQRRIGQREELAFGSQCALIAAELAMRFEAARDIERSLRYLQMAGAAALARCAYPESIELLRHGLELLPDLPAGQRPQHELDLLLPLGAALMAAQGYASDDVETTYQRALTLCGICRRPGDLERVLRGLWNVAFLRADLAAARTAAEKLLAQADAVGDAGLGIDAHTKLGQTYLHLGDLGGARIHLEQAMTASGSNDEAALRGLPRVAAYLAWALWYGGQPTQSQQRCDDALRLADAAASPHSSAFALGYVGWLQLMRGDAIRAQDLARRQAALSVEYGLVYWRLLAEFTLGSASASQGDAPRGLDLMRRAIAGMRSTGAKVGIPYLLCLLAEAELAEGSLERARATLADASISMASTGNALYGAEALRLEGELVRRADAGAAARRTAEQRFMSALACARRQDARALALRAATSLARLWSEEGETRRAVELLAPVCADFGEGFETADLGRARRLLAAMTVAPDAAREA